MKYISIGDKLINLDNVMSFSFDTGTYSETSKCVIRYRDGESESISMTSATFKKISARLDNFNLLI
jgi:hypothetical protein